LRIKLLITLLLLVLAGPSSGQTQWVLGEVKSCAGTDKVSAIAATGAVTCTADQGGGGVPAGSIILVTSGACPTGFTEVAGLAGKTLIGTTNGAGDVGTTGGNDNITPAGTNGSSTAAAQVFTGTPSSVVVNHVHLETAPTGQTGGQDSFTRDASTTGSSNTALSTANPTGGSASYTPAGTNGSSAVTAQTFTGTSFDNRSAWMKVIFCSKD